MTVGPARATARTVGSILEFDAATWTRLAGESGGAGDPFVSHAFLAALEASGSVGGATGWRPAFVEVNKAGAIVGAAPVYLKDHSYGEYVFDQSWAEAYERAGGRYYPKLVGAAPFTPVTGPRLLGSDAGLVADAIIAQARALRLATAHVNFVGRADADALSAAGFLMRKGVQFHWFNRNYADYDAFLSTLASRKRKAIRRERRIASEGLTIRRLRGDQISAGHWDALWAFYQDTGARKWGRPYLTRRFFDIIGQSMPDAVLLIVAERDGKTIAGALNLIGPQALYGRYWGCTEHREFLHFELCYHQAIEFAIEHGLSRVEAGAQGEHKLARGYEPVVTESGHWIADPGFRTAVADFLEREQRHVIAEIEALRGCLPFRNDLAE